MSNDSESISDTLAAKSDQLNADDLMGGPITVTVTGWKRGATKEQPVWLSIGTDRMPYSPCKTMRRVLAAEWGDRPAEWVGRSMTLYRDPNVMFGGMQVGGIRISHLSHMKQSESKHNLAVSKAKKLPVIVRRLEAEQPKQQTAQSSKQQQIDKLNERLEQHMQGDSLAKWLNTLGVTGNRSTPASWTREQFASASKFCDEMEGPIG